MSFEPHSPSPRLLPSLPALVRKTGPDNGGRPLSSSTPDKARRVRDDFAPRKGVLDGKDSRLSSGKLKSPLEIDESSESPLSPGRRLREHCRPRFVSLKGKTHRSRGKKM